MPVRGVIRGYVEERMKVVLLIFVVMVSMPLYGMWLTEPEINAGITLIHKAAAENEDMRLKGWLKSDSRELHASDSGGKTPLHYAAQHGSLEACGVLLDYQADVRSKDSQGFTPLYYALFHKNEKTSELLLARGARLSDIPETSADERSRGVTLLEKVERERKKKEDEEKRWCPVWWCVIL